MAMSLTTKSTLDYTNKEILYNPFIVTNQEVQVMFIIPLFIIVYSLSVHYICCCLIAVVLCTILISTISTSVLNEA